MGKVYLNGPFYFAKCDVCEVEIDVTKLLDKKVKCSNCGCISAILNVGRYKWEMFEMGFLTASAWLKEEKKKYVKHVDGNVENNAATNLEWSDEPDLINIFDETELGF